MCRFLLITDLLVQSGMKKHIIFWILILISTNLSATPPITVAGVNLFMSAEEIISAVKSRSLMCYRTQGRGANSGEEGYCCCAKGVCQGFRNKYRGISFRFKSGTKRVKRIDISCEVTNSCGLEIRDIAEILVQEGIINHLDYEVVPIIDVNLGRYRGRGPAGDELMVNPTQSSVLNGSITLQLSRKISRETNF